MFRIVERQPMKRIPCIIIAAVSLLLGLLVYLLFNQATYIYSFLPEWLRFQQLTVDNSILDMLLKNYCADLLWAISFTFVVQSILMLKPPKVYLLLLTTVLGVAVEIMQLSSIINGTFDLFDILVYFLGSLISIIIIKIGGKRNEIN